MTGGDLGVQLGRLIFEATTESVGATAPLTREEAAKAFIERLTLLQFSASWRVAVLFPDSGIDSVLDDIRRTGVDLLESKGLKLKRDKIDKFQKGRFGQYYAAIRQNATTPTSEVLARTFLERCTPGGMSSDRPTRDRMIHDMGRQLEQLNHQIDVFVVAFTGNGPNDAAAPAETAASGDTMPSEQALPVRVKVHPKGRRRDIYIELIAADLLEDMDDLSAFRRTLYGGASVVGAGGLILVGYETYRGDWLTTLVAGALLLLAGGLANHHHRLRTARLRHKWITRFSRLDAEQRSAVLSELDASHPLLLTKLGL
jgi:hypothetical protein